MNKNHKFILKVVYWKAFSDSQLLDFCFVSKVCCIALLLQHFCKCYSVKYFNHFGRQMLHIIIEICV